MNKQAMRLKEAVEAKRTELIELFEMTGQKQLPCGRSINELTLTELQELYRRGLRK